MRARSMLWHLPKLWPPEVSVHDDRVKAARKFRRRRMAELTSGLGALVLGIGIGALLAERLGGAGMWLLMTGAVVHAWGMYDKHRIEQGSGLAEPWWSTLLYWVCWALLGLGALVLLLRMLA